MSDSNEHNSIIHKRPLISIIMAVYNAADDLERTLRQLSIQTFDDFEVLVIDGGSRDHTAEVVKRYSGLVARFVSEPDRGPYDAMNKGIALSSGEWVYFLNAGDLLWADLSDVAVHLLPGVDMAYGDSYWPKHNIIYNGAYDRTKLLYKNICHQTIFYARHVFDKQQFDLHFKYKADYMFNLELFYRNGAIARYMPLMIARYDDWSGLSKDNVDTAFERHFHVWVKKNVSLPQYIRLMSFLSFMRLGRKIKRSIGK
jgi:glycosyltransferase involved in cell wall biosynthesis